VGSSASASRGSSDRDAQGSCALIIAALALALLPFVLDAVGLPLRTAIERRVFAVACMGLNAWSATPAWCRSGTAPGSGSVPMRRA